MTNIEIKTCHGGCSCGKSRYQLATDPLIVHCCHCRQCQKQTGASFALNALIESERVELLSGEVEEIAMPTPSGFGQNITRCRNCRVALWSNYHMGGLKERIRFIRVGTLDNPDLMPPDIHIYTSTKQPWVNIRDTDHAVSEFYSIKKVWSDDSLRRRKELVAAI